MGESILIVGPHRKVQDQLDAVWSELNVEKQRFTSTDAALEVIQSGEPPSAILVSYPLWDRSLDELLEAMDGKLPSDRLVPVVVLATEESLLEVESLEERGITVLSEAGQPEELRQSFRNLLRADRRAHPRIIVSMAVQVGAGSILRACQSENISLSGMLIRTSEEFPIESHVRLEFALGDHDQPIRCYAQVVRHTDLDSGSSRGVGVHFLSFENDGLESLQQFLDG